MSTSSSPQSSDEKFPDPRMTLLSACATAVKDVPIASLSRSYSACLITQPAQPRHAVGKHHDLSCPVLASNLAGKLYI